MTYIFNRMSFELANALRNFQKIMLSILFTLFVSTPIFGWITKTSYILVPMGFSELDKKDVTIKHVDLDSPASRAGLKIGDEIYKINKKRVNNIEQLKEESRKIAPIKGQDVEIEVRREGEIKNSFADISKIQRLLTYEPQCGFEKGLEKVVEWFRRKAI